ALILAMTYNGPHKIFNIGSGSGVNLNELVALIELELKRKILVQHYPGRQVDVPANILDIALAKQFLNWSPKITLSKGIKLVLEQQVSGS
ncbi:MAG: NAD-dependent epimerase/dehydratase family protein, partial [Gammaproteobacteria bacterium]|nr:NAD-dependent epimerase/dehydratase family protein [Gammaproteobacteria bacterium]